MRKINIAVIVALSIIILILSGLLCWSHIQCEAYQETLASIEQMRAAHQQEKERQVAEDAEKEKQAEDRGKALELAAADAKESARAAAHKAWWRFSTGIDRTITRRCILELSGNFPDDKMIDYCYSVNYTDVDDIGSNGYVYPIKFGKSAQDFAKEFKTSERHVATVTFGRGWKGLEIQEVKDWADSVDGPIDASVPAMEFRAPRPPPKTVPMSETSLGSDP